MLKTENIVDYLEKYISKYREEYSRFTFEPPKGGGYPSISISPYLYSNELICYYVKNGIVIVDYSFKPSYQWHIAGGPALLVDYSETRVPSDINKLLEKKNPSKENIGIYRIVSKDGFSEEVWQGELPQAEETIKRKIGENTLLRVKRMILI